MTTDLQVRGHHPNHYRSGEWATVVDGVWYYDQPCFHVVFPDGKTDFWVINDPLNPLEFREYTP